MGFYYVLFPGTLKYYYKDRCGYVKFFLCLGQVEVQKRSFITMTLGHLDEAVTFSTRLFYLGGRPPPPVFMGPRGGLDATEYFPPPFGCDGPV
jgi:hypothetical protein